MTEYSSRPIRVTLIQHSTRNDNLGVGALTVAEVEILREISREIDREIAITIAEWKGVRDPCVSGPDITLTGLDRQFLVSPLGYFALARASDLIIDIGAGDSFADIYGVSRLRRMFWLKGLAHLSGTPLVMAPQTIGPFTRQRTKRLARWTLRRSALVASRDRLSTEAARQLGREDVIEASDVALRLPYDLPPPRDPQTRPRVGINVSGLLMNGGYTGKNEFGMKADYPALMRDLVQYFLTQGCEVHLIGHVLPETAERSGSEDDAAANRQLARDFPEVIQAPHFKTPSEAKSYIANMDFFMGARMHACIAAFSSGVPVVPMAYSRKFAGLFGTIGYDRTVDCISEDHEAVFEKIVEAYADRAVLAREAEAALQTGLARLKAYQEALTGLLRGLQE